MVFRWLWCRMGEFPAHIDESALDLSIFADYPTVPSVISQNSSSILIELPISTISILGSDKVPFYLEASGQLVLANFIYERVNESIVLKHVAVPPSSNPQVNEGTHVSSVVDPPELPDISNSPELANASDDDQKLLKQKVKDILSRPLSIVDTNDDIIVGGYNISKLVQTAGRLKDYRIKRSLSQAKLSELICRNSVGELKFSQTFLCRFENLEVTLRVALRANPYLEKWLDRFEEQEKAQEETLCRVQDSDAIGNFIPHHASSSSPMETNTTDGLMTELLDLRERISPATSGNKETSCCNYDDVGEGEENGDESVQLPKRRNRKKRVHFTEAAVAQMMEHYTLNPWPRGHELTRLAESLGYGRESVRLWFVNRRYQFKLASKL
nr:Pou2 [Hymenolepis microstoma]